MLFPCHWNTMYFNFTRLYHISSMSEFNQVPIVKETWTTSWQNIVSSFWMTSDRVFWVRIIFLDDHLTLKTGYSEGYFPSTNKCSNYILGRPSIEMNYRVRDLSNSRNLATVLWQFGYALAFFVSTERLPSPTISHGPSYGYLHSILSTALIINSFETNGREQLFWSPSSKTCDQMCFEI
jgi:hypothetical protein